MVITFTFLEWNTTLPIKRYNATAPDWADDLPQEQHCKRPSFLIVFLRILWSPAAFLPFSWFTIYHHTNLVFLYSRNASRAFCKNCLKPMLTSARHLTWWTEMYFGRFWNCEVYHLNWLGWWWPCTFGLRVWIEGSTSDFLPVRSGVSQGSLFASTHFNICMYWIVGLMVAWWSCGALIGETRNTHQDFPDDGIYFCWVSECLKEHPPFSEWRSRLVWP